MMVIVGDDSKWNRLRAELKRGINLMEGDSCSSFEIKAYKDVLEKMARIDKEVKVERKKQESEDDDHGVDMWNI